MIYEKSPFTFDLDQAHTVLSHLGVKSATPTLGLLDDLVHAYTRAVPWESATRIAKRARVKEISACPRWPEEFWRDDLERGSGGTCFESNYAFYSLLRALGYQGYLTINDMGDTRSCHTAIITDLGETRWLVDVGIPLYKPLPIIPGQQSTRASAFHNYNLSPGKRSHYQVERDHHPSAYIYTLIDEAVDEGSYREATTADYAQGGFFLDQVIINKIVGERAWRFNSRERPYHLVSFTDGLRTDHPIKGDVAEVVASHFAMDVETVRIALDISDGR